MSDFVRTLQDLDRRLDLPEPARSRVLLEVASDLEDLERHFLDRGLSPEAARREAIGHCDLSPEALAQLVQVHCSPYRRFLDRLGAQARSRWERILLALFLAFELLAAGRLLVSGEVFRTAGWIAWPALGLTLLALLLAGVRLYALELRQEHRAGALHRGHDGILFLAGLNLAFGVYGYAFILHQAARGAAMDFAVNLPGITRWLLQGSALLIVCLLGAVCSAVPWFLLERRAAAIERAAAASRLVVSPSQPPEPAAPEGAMS